MYIQHFRKDFYELLIGSRVLIIAAPDVDSVCAVKILQNLFHMDGIPFTLVCAEGHRELKEHFAQYHQQVKNVVLVNCGGTEDIMKLLDNPKDVVIYILDSHRPTHILNIYDDSQQIRLVIPPDESEKEKIPKFEDIFREDADSDYDSESADESDGEDELNGEGDSDEVGGSRKSNRRKKSHEHIERRRERRDWTERRDKLLFEYSQFSYYGAPASLIMLEVAWTMSRGGTELVWYSIVGLTDSYIMQKMSRHHYVTLAVQLQDHVARIKHSQQNQRDIVKLNFENEICLHLYRHWNVYESLLVTPDFACKFKFWLGEKQLNRFLLDLGLPLVQCRQKFPAMELHIRKTLKEIFEKKASKWGLDNVTIPSFTRQVGMKRTFSAIDCHLATMAIMESPSTESSLSQKFKGALDSLPSDNTDEVIKGVEGAKILLKTIRQQVEAFLETQSIISVGPFLLATISEGAIDTQYFVNQNSLILLARFTLMAAVESSRSRRTAALPLIMVVPCSPGVFLVIGIPPLDEDCGVGFNLFGKAFEHVAEVIGEGVALDSFETFIVQVAADKKKKFIDKLLEVMEF